MDKARIERYRQKMNFVIDKLKSIPQPVKIEIINNYKVIFGNQLEISEYFYHFRKLWKDMEKRYRENQFASIKEKRQLLRKMAVKYFVA